MKTYHKKQQYQIDARADIKELRKKVTCSRLETISSSTRNKLMRKHQILLNSYCNIKIEENY